MNQIMQTAETGPSTDSAKAAGGEAYNLPIWMSRPSG